MMYIFHMSVHVVETHIFATFFTARGKLHMYYLDVFFLIAFLVEFFITKRAKEWTSHCYWLLVQFILLTFASLHNLVSEFLLDNMLATLTKYGILSFIKPFLGSKIDGFSNRDICIDDLVVDIGPHWKKRKKIKLESKPLVDTKY